MDYQVRCYTVLDRLMVDVVAFEVHESGRSWTLLLRTDVERPAHLVAPWDDLFLISSALSEACASHRDPGRAEGA